MIDEDGVRAKFGVGPASIPDYLALVGDSADGFPGLSGWGAKTTATVLARYEHLEAIPDAPGEWDVPIRGVAGLAATLAAQRDLALLFRDLATLRTEPPAMESVEELRWVRARDEFVALCDDVLDAPNLAERAQHSWQAGRLAGRSTAAQRTASPPPWGHRPDVPPATPDRRRSRRPDAPASHASRHRTRRLGPLQGPGQQLVIAARLTSTAPSDTRCGVAHCTSSSRPRPPLAGAGG